MNDLIERIDARTAFWGEGGDSCSPTVDLLRDCRAEIESLRTALDISNIVRKERRAEIERLTLALKDSQAINLGFAQDRETTDAEIQRLEALREYAPMTNDELTNLAKKWQVDTAECMNLGQPRLPLFHTYIEAEVIKRAGLRIKEEK